MTCPDRKTCADHTTSADGTCADKTTRATHNREHGAASVLAVGVSACLLAAADATVAVSMSLAISQRADGAADSAALAAADVASGLKPGIPCDAARLVATANGSDLTGCLVDGMVVTVHVVVSSGVLPVSARATAGPPRPDGR